MVNIFNELNSSEALYKFLFRKDPLHHAFRKSMCFRDGQKLPLKPLKDLYLLSSKKVSTVNYHVDSYSATPKASVKFALLRFGSSFE